MNMQFKQYIRGEVRPADSFDTTDEALVNKSIVDTQCYTMLMDCTILVL